MSKFLKFLIVSSLLVVFTTAIHTTLQACWNGFEQDKYNYRFWLFQPDLISSKALQLLSYSDFESDFQTYDGYGSTMSGRRYADTSFYVQNAAEWQAALAADPSVKTAKNVSSQDILTVLYNLNPEDYFRKMEGDSLRNNTFIQAIAPSRSLANYLDFAKTCEQLMNFMDPWTNDSEGHDQKALRKYSAIGESVIQKKETPLFVRERTAFLMLKMAHYLDDSARVKSLYKRFFEKANSKSWVAGSASFYYAVAHSNDFERNYLLSQTFENSIDKREQSLRFFDPSDSILRGSLKLAKNVHEKARMMTLPILMNGGQQLKELKEVYGIEPQNGLLTVAIQREINKLETWIYTNKFTEYGSASTSSDYEAEEKQRESGISQKDIDAKNLKTDLAYLGEVTTFVNRVVADRKQPDMAYWSLAAGHLAFMKKDFATAKKYLAAAKTEKNTPTPVQTQIWLTELLCDLYAAEHIDKTAEAAILKFDEFLRKQKHDLRDYRSFRSQIMRFLSDRFLKDGKTAQGMLILSKSTLTFGSIHHHWEKNFYHKLLEIGTPQDFEKVIDIVDRKKRAELTPFELWLASEPKTYYSPHVDYERCQITPEWDVDKLKDYESIIYVNQDKLDSAYLVVKTVSDTFWRDWPYQEYMTGDPFIPNLDSRLHAGSNVSYNEGDWRHPIYPKAKYTKPAFLKRLIELKKQVANDPVKYEKNYFLIGTAYHNMTEAGQFWLMSQIYWGYRDFEKGKEFNDNFYGSQRASAWFAKGVKNCKDEKLAAMCCFMANQCQHFRDAYQYELDSEKAALNDNRPEFKAGETPLWADLRQRFKGAKQYENKEYWCQNLDNLMLKYK